MDEIDLKKPVSANVSNYRDGYEYKFDPDLKPDLKNIPEDVKDYVAKVVVPRGGGFMVNNAGALTASGEHIVTEVVSLHIPRTVYRDQVETLFKMMQKEGIDINITMENYPKRKKEGKFEMPDIVTGSQIEIKKKVQNNLPRQ